MIAQQNGDQRTEQHAEDDPAIGAQPGHSLHLHHLKVCPAGDIHSHHVQQVAAEARKLAGHRPNGTGHAEIVGAQHPRQADRDVRVPIGAEQFVVNAL